MIKKLVTLAALAMLLGSPASYAADAFMKGKYLADDCEQDDAGFEDGFCYGYVIGIFDKMSRDAICAPDGVTITQAVSIVRKYFRENPENLHFGAETLVSFALLKAFPCN